MMRVSVYHRCAPWDHLVKRLEQLSTVQGQGLHPIAVTHVCWSRLYLLLVWTNVAQLSAALLRYQLQRLSLRDPQFCNCCIPMSKKKEWDNYVSASSSERTFYVALSFVNPRPIKLSTELLHLHANKHLQYSCNVRTKFYEVSWQRNRIAVREVARWQPVQLRWMLKKSETRDLRNCFPRDDVVQKMPSPPPPCPQQHYSQIKVQAFVNKFLTTLMKIFKTSNS